MHVSLRKAEVNDAEAILGINLRSIFELCSTSYEVSALRQWVGERTAAYFEKSIARGQIYVAEVASSPVGFIDVMRGEVLAIYVLPGFERKGIGRFLLTEAVRLASADEQSVTVFASLNAVPFYERSGFTRVNETSCVRNGVELPLVEMKLRYYAATAETEPATRS